MNTLNMSVSTAPTNFDKKPMFKSLRFEKGTRYYRRHSWARFIWRLGHYNHQWAHQYKIGWNQKISFLKCFWCNRKTWCNHTNKNKTQIHAALILRAYINLKCLTCSNRLLETSSSINMKLKYSIESAKWIFSLLELLDLLVRHS